MPYGVPQSAGGDSQANTAKMESCVSSVMKKQGVSKGQAIAICKASLFKRKRRD